MKRISVVRLPSSLAGQVSVRIPFAQSYRVMVFGSLRFSQCCHWLTMLLVCGVTGEGFAVEPVSVRPFFKAHCLGCHDADTVSGGLDLVALKWLPEDRANFDKWVRIFDRIRTGEMPPAEEKRPPEKIRQTLEQALQSELHRISQTQQASQGRTILRRLNRIEYENTLHELLAIDVPLQHLLPEDTPAHGFDTVAEGLRISPLQIEKLLETTDVALSAAIEFGPPPEQVKKRMTYKEERGIRQNLDTPDGKQTDPNNPRDRHRVIFRELDDAVIFFSDGYSPTELRQFSTRDPGRYRIRISGYGFQSGTRPVLMRVFSNNFREKRLLGEFDMPPGKPREVEIVARLGVNEHLVVVPFDTGYDEQGRGVWQVSGPQFAGSGLAVQWVEVEGPLTESWPPSSVARIFGDLKPTRFPQDRVQWRNGRHIAYTLEPERPESHLQTLLSRFAERAFRRPLRSGEVDEFVALAQEQLQAKKPFVDAVRIAIRAIITAPQCLLLEEPVGRLDDYSLASRLSYFLWSAPPDAELLQLAIAKSLTNTDVLESQVERMLASPKSQAFVRNFTGQWLDLRKIDATSPDQRLYPEFDDVLKRSMVLETEAFFREMLTENLPVSELIDSRFAMLNRRMAEHYHVPDVIGEEFRRVNLPADSPRGGLLTQASLLKVTANGTVTSPVMRGAWVQKRILGLPPPPPPPVAAIEPDTRGATTVREQLAKHRNSPVCNSCHKSIDPPGFALESFDVIGGWREQYRSLERGEQPKYKLRGHNIWQYKIGPAVDSSGELVTGQKFDDIREFKALLLKQQPQVLKSLTENLLIYSTGAGLSFADRHAVDELVADVQKRGGGLKTLVTAVVLSDTFRSK